MSWGFDRTSVQRALLAVLLMCVAIVAVDARPAGASAATECVGTLSGGTYGNVTVPKGESCALDDTVVITGNFTADRAVDVVLSGTSIDGDVTITKTTGSFVVINAGTTIGGNVTVNNNDEAFVILVGSCASGGISVAGDATVNGNDAVFAVAANCSTFDGNVTMNNNTAELDGGSVQADCSTVGGNLTANNNTAYLVEVLGDCTLFGGPAGSTAGNVTFNGNFGFGDVVGEGGAAVFGFVGAQNITVKNNTGVAGIAVGANDVVGNLICSGNDPDPIDFGFPNTAGGANTCG